MRTLLMLTLAALVTASLGAAVALPPELPQLLPFPPQEDTSHSGNNSTGGGNGGNQTGGGNGNNTGGDPGNNNTGGDPGNNNTGGGHGNNTGGGNGNNNTGGGNGNNTGNQTRSFTVTLSPPFQVAFAGEPVAWRVQVCSAEAQAFTVSLSGTSTSGTTVVLAPDQVTVGGATPCADGYAVTEAGSQVGLHTVTVTGLAPGGSQASGWATYFVG